MEVGNAGPDDVDALHRLAVEQGHLYEQPGYRTLSEDEDGLLMLLELR